MRLTLLVLGAALLCAVAAQEAPRGRERLRQLVQKARAGDAEAQAILASRRRKIGRQRAESAGAGNARENAAVEAALGGAVRSSSRRQSFQASSVVAETPAPRGRLPLSRNRQRGSRRGGSRASEVAATTFRPAILTTTEAPTTTTQAPIQLTAAPVQEFQPAAEKPVPVRVQEVDQTPNDAIPSLFQPAQFGPRPVQRVRNPVSQQRTPVQRTELRQRTDFVNEPHRAINSGLEVDSRSELFSPVAQDPTEETSRKPAVQTTRRYSYFDEAGNYVFGYEAEDGSFKEEVRGRDCIVNGKYGYVDPTGIRREFTYVSGNKCDPNNPDNLLPDGSPIPLNDQFLQQTQQEQLGAAELAKLAANRRRQPTQRTESVAQPDRSSRRLSSRPASRPTIQLTTSRPRPAPARAPARAPERAPARAPERAPVRAPERAPARAPEPAREPASRPVDLTPSNVIPDMFKPAQFGPGGRGVQPTSDRFPVPNFINQAPQRVEPSRQVNTRPPIRVPDLPQVTSRPTTAAPPREIITHSPTLPPRTSFNFEQEFNNNFLNHFGSAQPARPRPAPARAPRPTPAPAPRPTQPPRPAPTPARAPSSNTIPSLFRPAQFNDNRPVPTQAPARPPINDNAFVLTSQQPSSAPQLVFDASTGAFKTVNVQPGTQFNAAPRRPPPPPPAAPAPVNPFTSTSSTGGRPLPLFLSSGPSNTNAKSPLPPIPTSAAEFDSFFSQLG